MNGTPHRQAISTALWIAGARWVASAIVRLWAARVRGPRDNLYTQVAPFEGLRGREPHWYLYRAERRNRSPRAR